jgi:hypothetical protein
MKQKLTAAAFILGLLVGGAAVFFIMKPSSTGSQISEPVGQQLSEPSAPDLEDADVIPESDLGDMDAGSNSDAADSEDNIPRD